MLTSADRADSSLIYGSDAGKHARGSVGVLRLSVLVQGLGGDTAGPPHPLGGEVRVITELLGHPFDRERSLPVGHEVDDR
jgi:hypothetical protein